MAIPGFQDIMLPVLKLTADGAEHRLRDLADAIPEHFNLSEEERSRVLPSGQQTVVHNRVAWARTYMVKAGLLEATRRGYVRITDTGKQLLADAPESISVALLRERYPAIEDFVSRTPDNGQQKGDAVAASETADETPEETLERAYQQLRNELADELLKQATTMPPEAFERLVVELLVQMGYGGTLKDAGRAVGQSNDGGIDGIIKENRLGLDTIYVQAKRYTDQAVSRPAIQAFVGALQGFRARKGVFITTSRFAGPAVEYVENIETKVVLIDGQQLAEYMIDFDIGVTRMRTFDVKRLDSDYFEDV